MKKKANKKQVTFTIEFHNCTINLDERQNNSTNHKKELKGCTVNKE